MKKHTFYTEAAYIIGLAVLALGTAMMESANFGMSMVVAPAYLFYLKLNPILPFFTFGMAEYMLQFVLLALLCMIMRRVKKAYLFSFATAVIYGLMLDGCMYLAGLWGAIGMPMRVFMYLAGMAVCSAGISLLFNTYISPEAYELFVMELSSKTGIPLHRFKTIYDICSCLISVLLSFLFFGFGKFEGVKAGTIFCALINGTLIGLCSRMWARMFVFRDGLKMRKFFEGK